MAFEIEVDGVEEAQRKFGVDVVELLRAPFQRRIVQIEGRMKAYPPPIGAGVWAANTTVRQRRAFFAQLRRGQIRGSRSGTLGRRWTNRIERTADGLMAETGNNTEYGPWVQSAAAQVAFHRGRWQTDEQVAMAEAPTLVADVERTLRRLARE